MGRTSEALVARLNTAYLMKINREEDPRNLILEPSVDEYYTARSLAGEAMSAVANGLYVFILSGDIWGREFGKNIASVAKKRKTAEITVFERQDLPSDKFAEGLALRPKVPIQI